MSVLDGCDITAVLLSRRQHIDLMLVVTAAC